MCLSHLLIALALQLPHVCVCGMANWSKFQAAEPWSPTPCKAVALSIVSILKKRVPSTMQGSGSQCIFVAAVDHRSTGPASPYCLPGNLSLGIPSSWKEGVRNGVCGNQESRRRLVELDGKAVEHQV